MRRAGNASLEWLDGCARSAHRSAEAYSFRKHGSALARVGAQPDARRPAGIVRALLGAWLHLSALPPHERRQSSVVFLRMDGFGWQADAQPVAPTLQAAEIVAKAGDDHGDADLARVDSSSVTSLRRAKILCAAS